MARVVEAGLGKLRESIEPFIKENSIKQEVPIDNLVDQFESINSLLTEQHPDTATIKQMRRTDTESVTDIHRFEITAWQKLVSAVDSAFEAVEDSAEKQLKLREWVEIKENGIGRYMTGVSYAPEDDPDLSEQEDQSVSPLK